MSGLMQPGPTLYEAERLRKKRGSQGLLGEIGEPLSYAPGPVGLLGNALLGAQHLTGEKSMDEGMSALAMLTALANGTRVGPAVTNVVKGGKAISDWKWRPAKEVNEELSLTEVPPYISEGYGRFMQDQRGKALNEALGPRDLVKAYTITRSSVNRGAREINDDIAKGAIRPEGYFSEWLLTPKGKAYLDDAQRGVVNEEAINDIRKRFVPFGMADTLASDLAYAAKQAATMNSSINKAVTGPVDEYRAFAQQMHGIGPSKSGFLASLLGRGDLPTLDARQIALHTGKPVSEASKFIRRGGGAGGDKAVDRLAKRQEALGVKLDEELSPFYQHLTHHAVWDKVGNTKTTHDELVRAMKAAGVALPVLFGTGALYEAQNGGLLGP